MGEIQNQPFQLYFDASLRVISRVPASLPTSAERSGKAIPQVSLWVGQAKA